MNWAIRCAHQWFFRCAVTLCCVQPALAAPRAVHEKESLPRGPVAEAWTSPGFRLGLGVLAGPIVGQDRAPSATAVGVTVHAGWRFGALFSLATAFSYEALFGSLGGLRYAVTLEPTWHPFPGVYLAVGAGYAGVTGTPKAVGPDGFTATAPGRPLASFGRELVERDCERGGVVALLRAGYNFRLGRVGATGPSASFATQAIPCIESYWSDEKLLLEEVTDWWPHLVFSLGWTFLWR